MANILKVTTPVGGYDNSNNVRVNPELQNPVNVQGQVNTEKVTRPDARSDAASERQAGAMKYETNFDEFITQLRNSSSVTNELSKLLQEYSSVRVEAGINGSFAEEISKFLTMIEVGPERMAELMKLQSMSAVRYSGTFFELLRRVMEQTSSAELKNGILTFLKRYSDMAERGMVLKDIQRNINRITERMISQAREQALELSRGMIYDDTGEEASASNLKLLKNSLLPFFNSYISQFHDMGATRNMTARLSELMSRYENGMEAGVRQAFERLMEHPTFSRIFDGFETSRLFEVLANTEFERSSAKNAELAKLSELICRGAAGEVGSENKQVFREILNSLLLNESVYMPLLHLMMPVKLDDRLMFSELWIDPDAGGGREKEDGGRERVIKGLVKFDIQDVGFFDLYFLYSEGKVSVKINMPHDLQDDENRIRQDIGRMFREHMIQAEEIVTGKSRVSTPITDVFTNLKERKTSVNVSV